jgi:Tropinone reductase 1
VGTNVKKPTLEITAEDFSLVMSTNFESAYHMSQLAHPLLKASGAGSIVLLSSVSGLRSIGCGSVYEATKGNLLMQSYIFSLTAYIYIYIYSLLINLNYVCKFMSCFIYIYAGAMDQLTRSLACEWAKDNIRTNSVAPGATRTTLIDDVMFFYDACLSVLLE